ncbi:MAG: collagen-binding protein [Cyclobacteriaceae bacterium]|nr:MAG: collagen-binding protein [Cyclobacteriaceae bacterium]
MCLNAQNINNIIVDADANGRTVSDFLSEVEQKYGVDFIGAEPQLQSLIIGGIEKRTYMYSFLEDVLKPYSLAAVKVRDNVMFILDEKTREEFGNKKGNYLLINPDKLNVLEGKVLEASSNEPVYGAQVVLPKLGTGTLTDEKGAFEINMPPGRILRLNIQYVGYDTRSYLVGFSPYSDENSITTSMLTSSMELEGIIVTADRSDNVVQGKLAGIEKLDIKDIKELPTFFGEVDPIRSLSTLPGISIPGEISSGFNVRGGQSGQNLIRQDNAIIYNPTHLFGFFSAFNPDMISNVELYKGGGPATFGGRVASVLDIKLRNGDAGRLTLKGGVGMISSRLTIEGPIVKSKSSFLIGARISYADWLLKATDDVDLRNSTADFNDINAKFFQSINDNNIISISGYRSYDSFRLNSDSTFSWGTTNLTVNWDHIFNQRLVSNTSIASSNYYSKVSNNNEIEAFQYKNAINNLSLKSDFIFTRSEKEIYNTGFEINHTVIEPGRLQPAELNNTEPVDINDQRSLEIAAYIQSDFEITSKLAFSAGLRYSHFLRLGEDAIYRFDYNNLDGRYPSITDTTTYSRNEIIQSYNGLEPRISLRYLLNSNSSIKASYYRGYQYLHLVSNTTSVTPQDYWIASGPYLKPLIGDQYSIGFFKTLSGLELSTEFFYKNIDNAVDYIEGADITLNESLEAGLAQGQGTAYGAELFVKKSRGKLNGWLSYTYSRSLVAFDSSIESLNINQGRQYPTNYDQPHNISLVLNYRLGPRTTLSSNFNYQTGRPITIPISKFTYDAYLAALNYSSRNQYRIPDYHRLDLSLTIKDREKPNTRFRGEWVLSVFNVYGRKNAYSVYFNQYGRAYKLSVLGNIFPSVTYNFSL